ncbi:hypothetical protein [Roseibium sp.]|uniref:hypothetical protein n=1 Tax=Roseibium sp. TaxID=1936156 RepID=UPI00391A013F
MTYTEQQRFTAWCLWLAGFSATNIGKVLGLRRKQALGICQRNPFGPRDKLSRQERETALQQLRSARMGDDGKPIDRGLLNDFPWKTIDDQI